MKKLLLFLAGAFLSAGAMAQENHGILFSPITSQSGGILVPASSPLYTPHVFAKEPIEAKGTKTTYSDWYDQWSALKDASITGNLFYWETYPDSSLITTSGRGTYCHGLGLSFDPADSSFYYNALSSTAAVSAPIPDTFAYIVDTFVVEGAYVMNNAGGTHDSLIVDLEVSPEATATDSGVYKLRYSTANAAFMPISYDGRPRFTTAAYSRANHDTYTAVSTQKRRFAFALTASTLTDTVTGGAQRSKVCVINPPLIVPKRQNILSFVHFKSGTAYPTGTPVTSANLFHLYAGEPSGTTTWTRQSATDTAHGYMGSYQNGLIAQNQTIYGDTAASAPIHAFQYSGHDVLIPAVAFAGGTPNDPAGFSTPLQYFHIKWNSDGTIPTAIYNVEANNISSRAYPNPATTIAYVPFTLTQSANVSITYTNSLGQVIGVQNLGKVIEGKGEFNTAALAAGVYFYTINADGLRATGRIVVAH